MKLVIQIPCLNEEESLPITLGDLPKEIRGIDEIEILVIDDGSTDRTIETARKHGIRNFVEFTSHKGLARAFSAGLNKSLKMGADIIVNTDADNQYCGEDIVKLVEPILEESADIVIGDRQTDKIKHFSKTKKILQKIGTRTVKRISGVDVSDATSGFRAYSREAALKLNVISKFTYTLDTIIQAGNKGLTVTSVPIRTNPKLRESRLFKGIWSYVWMSIKTIIGIYAIYNPKKVFFRIATLFLAAAFLIGTRYLYLTYVIQVQDRTYLASLILLAILAGVGITLIVVAYLAELIAVNRAISEDILYRLKKNKK